MLNNVIFIALVMTWQMAVADSATATPMFAALYFTDDPYQILFLVTVPSMISSPSTFSAAS